MLERPSDVTTTEITGLTRKSAGSVHVSVSHLCARRCVCVCVTSVLVFAFVCASVCDCSNLFLEGGGEKNK